MLIVLFDYNFLRIHFIDEIILFQEVYNELQ